MKQDTVVMLNKIRDRAHDESRELWPDADPWAYAFGSLKAMIEITLDKFPDAKAFFIDQFSVKRSSVLSTAKPETKTEQQ